MKRKTGGRSRRGRGQQDPAVDTVAMATRRLRAPLNNARVFITPEAARPARRRRRSRSSPGCGRRLDKVEGAAPVHAGRAGRAGRRPRVAHRIPIYDAGSGLRRAQCLWSPKLLDKLKTPAGDSRRRDRPGSRPAQPSRSTINRDQAARYGISAQLIDDTLYDAFGQRQVTQYFTQVNSYHVILEILPRDAGQDRFARTRSTFKSPVTGGQVPLSAITSLDQRSDRGRYRSAIRASSRR